MGMQMKAAGSQKTLNSTAASPVQDNKQVLKPGITCNNQVALHKEATIESFLRPSEDQGKIVLPNSVIFQHSSHPPKHIPLHAYPPPLPQNQNHAQGIIPGIAGVATPSNVQAPLLLISRSSLPQVSPSLLHHSRPVETTSIGHQHQGNLSHTSLQQSLLPHPLASQVRVGCQNIDMLSLHNLI